MQVIWSRVAQTRPCCRCRSCLNAATSIARRTTAAASRRGWKIGDIFIAGYSTILATAAVADSTVKENRRKEWDRLIAEAKGGKSLDRTDGIDQVSMASKIGSTTESLATDLQLNTYGSTTHALPPTAVLGHTYWTTQQQSSPSSHFATQLKALDAHIEQSLMSSTAAGTTAPIELAHMQEWLDEDDRDGLLPARDWLGTKTIHLERMEGMVAYLVARLLWASRTNAAEHPEKHKIDISLLMKEMSTRIEGLNFGHTQIPEFAFRSLQEVQEERLRLHTSLVAIFEGAASKKSPIDVVVAKICYNLLVSTAPPSMITYNILVRMFTRLQQYELGDVVVDIFLFHSRYKPNPATARIFLEHYTAKGDAVGFQRIVRRMNGMRGDMRIKRRQLALLRDPTLHAWARPIREWALSTKVIHRGKWLHQKFPRNERVFDALIKGSHQIIGLGAGIRYLRAAIREGQSVHSATLLKLIDTCINRAGKGRAIERARSLLYAILMEWERDVVSYFTAIDYDSATRSAIHKLLSICGINTSSQLEVGILEKASWNALHLMVCHMNLRALVEDVQQSSADTLALLKIFGISPSGTNSTAGVMSYRHGSEHMKGPGAYPQPREAVYKRVDLALNALKESSVRIRLYNRKKESDQISKLELLVACGREVIRQMQSEVISISYRNLLPQLQAKYDGLPTHERLPSRVTFLSCLHNEVIHDCSSNEPGRAEKNMAHIILSKERLPLRRSEVKQASGVSGYYARGSHPKKHRLLLPLPAGSPSMASHAPHIL